jgi:hypothetical protein
LTVLASFTIANNVQVITLLVRNPGNETECVWVFVKERLEVLFVLAKYKHFQIAVIISKHMISLVAWWLELLTNSHEVLGSILGSAMGNFLAGEDPHSDHGLGSL